MVERTQATGLDEFVGTAKEIEQITGNYGEEFHIHIKPKDESLIKTGKTGMFHEFLRVSKTATKASVPEGSILDNYLKELEGAIKEAKKSKTVLDALNLLLEKEVLYRRKKLGKAYGGHEAADHWVPVSVQK